MNGGAEILMSLLINAAFGGVCAAIANSKGRSGVGWFFGGFFLGCIALIIVACLSNLNEERAKWNTQDVQNRRLQEQLRQEQMKNETLRQHTMARLDKHDDALGIDTRVTGPALGMQAAKPNLLTPSVPTEDKAVWYLSVNGQQVGPIKRAELKVKLDGGEASAEDLVWREGMNNWQKVREVSELSNLFSI